MNPFRFVSCLLMSALVHTLCCFGQQPGSGPVALSGFQGLTIQRTGGYAGVQQDWYFSNKGVRWTPDGVSVQAPVDKLSKLRQLITVKHASIEKQIRLTPACFDCFIYRITVWHDNGRQTLDVTEFDVVDAPVRDLLGLVRDLIREVPSKP